MSKSGFLHVNQEPTFSTLGTLSRMSETEKKIRHTATKTTPNKPSSIAACAEAIPLNKRDPLRLPDYDAEDEAEDPSRSHSLLLIQML